SLAQAGQQGFGDGICRGLFQQRAHRSGRRCGRAGSRTGECRGRARGRLHCSDSFRHGGLSTLATNRLQEQPMYPNARAPRPLLPLAFAAAMLVSATGMAQESTRIEQQMTPEQFRAAGLDRLDAGQLANLNDWLNRTLDVETARATKNAEEVVHYKNRGFLGSTAREPVEARLNGSFAGFGKGRSYTLDNGQVWRQTDDATLYGVTLDNPQIKITPSLIGSAWYMQLEGYGTRAKVERTK